MFAACDRCQKRLKRDPWHSHHPCSPIRIDVYVYNIMLCYNRYFIWIILYYITKGSSRGATLSFTLRSKGEGGQPRYLILQEIASHFSTPPPSRPPSPPPSPPPPHLPRTLRADSKHCNLQYFCSFRIKKPHFATW